MMSDEEILQIIPEIISTPTKIFEYINDIQSFDRIIQILFNKSQLGICIDKISKEANDNNYEFYNNEGDLQLLYDIAYKYIPRKMNRKVSDERVNQTSEKTIQRLIKSKFNNYYNSLESIPSILVQRFDQYPWENYNKEVLTSIYINCHDIDIFKKMYSKLDEESIETCFNNSDDYQKEQIADYIIEQGDSEKYKNIIFQLSQQFLKNPNYLKYYNGELDKFSLIVIIGRGMKSEKYEEIKRLLLQKNISEEMIKTIENLFKMNYNHDLDSDIVFDD